MYLFNSYYWHLLGSILGIDGTTLNKNGELSALMEITFCLGMTDNNQLNRQYISSIKKN